MKEHWATSNQSTNSGTTCGKINNNLAQAYKWLGCFPHPNTEQHIFFLFLVFFSVFSPVFPFSFSPHDAA
jgi:hypothetical protein